MNEMKLLEALVRNQKKRFLTDGQVRKINSELHLPCAGCGRFSRQMYHLNSRICADCGMINTFLMILTFMRLKGLEPRKRGHSKSCLTFAVPPRAKIPEL